MSVRAVILIGGPQKGTRFRPLSLDIPKPFFPIAGCSLLEHHVKAISALPNLREVVLLGFFQPNEHINAFISHMKIATPGVPIKYLQEYTSLGTAGGLHVFRDVLLAGGVETVLLMNADVCGDFPLQEMLAFHQERAELGGVVTCLTTEVTDDLSQEYGCVVEKSESHEVVHYVEKPETFVSNLINCGIYYLSRLAWDEISDVMKMRQHILQNNGYVEDVEANQLSFETDVLTYLAAAGRLYSFKSNRFWSRAKSADSAIFANSFYLDQLRLMTPSLLAGGSSEGPMILGNVLIHPSAKIDPTAKLGPNVSIGSGVTIAAGVRVRESIVLDDATLARNCCILHAIVGWKASVGEWARVQGTPNEPDPNKEFAKLPVRPLFTADGRLNPSITVLGSSSRIAAFSVLLNSIVLPDKELNFSCKNQIVL